MATPLACAPVRCGHRASPVNRPPERLLAAVESRVRGRAAGFIGSGSAAGRQVCGVHRSNGGDGARDPPDRYAVWPFGFGVQVPSVASADGDDSGVLGAGQGDHSRPDPVVRPGDRAFDRGAQHRGLGAARVQVVHRGGGGADRLALAGVGEYESVDRRVVCHQGPLLNVRSPSAFRGAAAVGTATPPRGGGDRDHSAAGPVRGSGSVSSSREAGAGAMVAMQLPQRGFKSPVRGPHPWRG